ncbi:MAG: DUF4276 family protein [Rhizobiales bacterium]|nr:DUF4276 family protein [Hyphomicrobiales bacterium]
MTGVAVYVEGGGDSASAKTQMRHGMDRFLGCLKQEALKKGLCWKVVFCGSRNDTYRAFQNASVGADPGFVVLLVDSEAALNGNRCAHLRNRDNWQIENSREPCVRLMVQTMETWIIADPPKLGEFYGQHFQENQLPKATNLEEISKDDVAKGLQNATKSTQKGAYHKIRHASQLLKLIRQTEVEKRCPNCKSMFSELISEISKM